MCQRKENWDVLSVLAVLFFILFVCQHFIHPMFTSMSMSMSSSCVATESKSDKVITIYLEDVAICPSLSQVVHRKESKTVVNA